jgi:hypothetical protein
MNVAAQRFQTAVDLWATAIALRRAALRRQHGDASEAQIDELLNQWLAARPGAEFGDGPQPSGR